MRNTRKDIQGFLDKSQKNINYVILCCLLNGNFDNRISPAMADRIIEKADLTIKESQILSLRFDPARVRTYQEIGVSLGITRARVGQYINSIQTKIMAAIKGVSND